MELDEVLEEHKEWLERDASAGVVRCRLSGHAMPLRAESVSHGKQFEKLRARAVELKALKQYEPHIVPSAYVSDRLFCRITGRLVHMNEVAVLRHSEGKRFQTQLEFVRAGSGLKNETAPADEAQAASKPAEDASQPAMWCPPAHVLASESEESDDEVAAGKDGGGDDSAAEDDFDWGGAAAGDDDDEAGPVVVQPRARAAAKPSRRKRLEADVGGGGPSKKATLGPKRARKAAAGEL